MGQGGNVWEWVETVAVTNPLHRIYRGGYWVFEDNGGVLLGVEGAGQNPPSYADFYIGFRVASIPEPNSLWLAITAMMFVAWRRRTYYP
jgi:hypothetical protein